MAAHTRLSAAQLIQAAAQALAFRNQDALIQIAQALRALPSTLAQDAGDYYFALALNRAGRFQEALQLLEPLSDSPHTHFAARALQSMAGIHFSRQRLDEAARRNFHAARLLQRQRQYDLIASLFTQWNWAIIHSLDGNHQPALQTLLSLHSALRHVTLFKPYCWYEYQNSLAVELNAVGETEAARRCVNIALASPFAPLYPEWAETAREIEETNPERALLIAVQRQPEPEPKPDGLESKPVAASPRRGLRQRKLPRFCQRTAILDRIKHSMRSRSPPAKGETFMQTHWSSQDIDFICAPPASRAFKACRRDALTIQAGGQRFFAVLQVVVWLAKIDPCLLSGCDPPLCLANPPALSYPTIHLSQWAGRLPASVRLVPFQGA